MNLAVASVKPVVLFLKDAFSPSTVTKKVNTRMMILTSRVQTESEQLLRIS